MGIVWIVNNAGHDFKKAEQYGTLKFITEGNININRPTRDLYNISDKLREFNSKTDYLLLSGTVLVNMMVAAVLFLNQNTQTLKLLVYDAKQHEYIKHTLIQDRHTNLLSFTNEKTN